MVKTEFPDVKLIELQENIGIAGWNKGFELARGEYVLVLDDDSYPEYGTIMSGVDIMQMNQNVAVVGYKIYNKYFDLVENQNELDHSLNKIVEVLDFIGCGALINKGIFIKLGGYEESLFLYANDHNTCSKCQPHRSPV